MPLFESALPNLPHTVRTIGFEIHVDSTIDVEPHTLLVWWDNKMRWARLSQVLGRFPALETLQFGVVMYEDGEEQLLLELNREMEAIVRKRMPEMSATGKFRFTGLHE